MVRQSRKSTCLAMLAIGSPNEPTNSEAGARGMISDAYQ
jgi:hypothetical protein